MKHRLACLLTGFTSLAMPFFVGGSTSTQVEQVGQMAIHRSAHKATALSDGRVLITGGRNTAGIVIADAEIFDPNTEESSAVAPMATARVDHTATLLKDGRVLVTGGSNATGTLKSVEIFDPSTGTFSAVSGSMNMARARHTATLLSSGKVLIAGGDVTPTLVDPNGTDVTGTAEMFDPTAGTFGDLVLLQRSRSGHTATLFSNDKVWLAGGGDNTIESFDATAGAFTLSDTAMTAARSGHEAFALSSTSVLFFGGDTNHTIDQFNPSTGELNLVDQMNGEASSATLMANGKILVLRSEVAGLYDPAGAFIAFDEATMPNSTLLLRSGQSATELSGDKKILVAGGENAQHQPMLHLAVFNPARIWTDKDDYMPTDPVLLFGSGWKPNEDVYLYAVDSETEQWTYGSTAKADAEGSFAVQPLFIVEMRHLGTLFNVSAVGAQSNLQADVEFTDAVNFQSITVGPQSATPVAGTSSSVTYQLTGNYGGSGANPDDPVTLTFVGWTGANGAPVGVTVTSLSPASITVGSPNSNLTLQTSSSTTVAGTYTFTVQAKTAGGQTKTGTGTLTVAPGAATKIALSGATTNLASGATRTLTATIQDGNGNTVTSGANSTLSVTFAKTAGAGSVTGLGSTNAVAGVANLTVTGNQLGSVTIAASAGSLAAGTGNPITFTVVAGAASKLALSGSTADLAAGATRQLTATIQDANGNTITSGADSTLSVSFAKTAGTGTVTGLGSATASAGVATLTVTGNAPGSITITATATGSGGALTAGTGNPITFNIVAGAASKLALTGSTANLTAGATRQLTATIQDAAGNTIATGADSTLSVTFGKTTGAGNVSGLASVNAVAGVANITVTGTTAGSVTIGASATGSGGALTAGTGNPITFAVVANTTVDHFAFAPISSPQTAGTAFNITITAQDVGNNTVVGYNGNGFKVKLTSTGNLTGAPVTTPAFTNGVLTNQSVTITNTGNFTMTATDNGGTATGTSNTFQVNVGAANKLAFIQQPTATIAGQTITPAVTVQIQDANGNLTSSTASVALAIANNPSTGTLSGTTPVAAVNGVATFSDLSINKGGTGYTLQATSGALTSATSSAFNISNPAPTLTSIAPSSGNLSQTLDVVFNGTNYISGVTTVSFGANITVNTVTVNSGIKLTANITIGSGATVGQRNVSVTNPAPGGGTATLTNGFTVNNPATTTVVTSSSAANTSTYGQSVTFTATVSTASGTPTGSVTFYDSASCSGTVLAGPTNLDANGKATFTTTSLSAPGHSITGCYTPTGIYLASNGSVNQTINKAHLTVTADDQSKTYDSHIFTGFTSKITGFVNSETSSVVTGTAAYTGDATGAINVGTYTITPTVGTLTATNYDFTVFKDGTLTIGKADATWTTNPNSKMYGDNDPSPLTTGSGSGFAASDNVTATYTRAPGETVVGGPYHITAHLSPASVETNYNVTNAGADFNITKKNATWTTNPNSKTYGDIDPTPLTTGSGDFLASDHVSATYARAAGEDVVAGGYHITATLSSTTNALGNYNITNAGATFTIDKRDATWTTNPNSKTYGDADPNPLTTGSGNFLVADHVTAIYNRAAGENVTAVGYHITATLSSSGNALGNYNVTNAGATFTINKKDATWTTQNASKTYGEADPTPLTTGSGSGFLFSDDVMGTYTRDAGETVVVGGYHITAMLHAGTGVLANYNITNDGATFTVNKRDATWTTNPNSKIYGDADPDPLTTGSGDFLAADHVTANYTRATGEDVLAGGYYITATLSAMPATALSNYNITNLGATFTINKRPATVTADDKNKTYGDVNPGFTATVTGTVNSDVLNYSLATTAGQFSNAGNYAITVTLGLNPNYSVTPANGTLTIEQAEQTITWADPASIVYGTVLGATQLNATVAGVAGGTPPGALTYTPDAGTLLNAGPGQALKVDAVETTNYKPATKTVHINVEKATPTVTWADPDDITYGTALADTQLNAAFTWIVNGSDVTVPGTAIYAPAAGTVLNAGAGQTLHVSFTPTNMSNYNNASKDVSITVLKRPVTLTGTRVYNGTADAAFGILTVSNAVGTDMVTVASGTATLASKNVGTQAITSVGTLALGGAAAGNYTLTGATGSVIVTKLALTIKAVGDSRTYNGDTDSSATPQFVTLVGTDTGSATQVFDSKNAGARTLSVMSYTINDGNSGNNYGPITTNTASGSISTLALTINAVTDSKTYDGDKTSSKTPSFVTLVGTDTGTAVQIFDSKNAGSRTLSVSTYMITDGNGGANYGPVTKNTAAGSISTLALTINAVTDTKTFDNNTDSSKTPSFVTLVGGDMGTAVQVFDSKNAGARTLSVSTYSITDGNSGNNYGPVTKNTAAGTINAAQTSTGVTSSKNPAALAEPVTFTATVTNTQTSPIPTGTVTFTYTNAALNLSGTLGTASVDGAGKAMLTSASLPVNANVVKATYNNVDGNFVSATFGTITQNASYIFVGFLQPIDNLPTLNSAKAGQSIPIKWQLKDYAGNLISDLGTLSPNGLTSGAVACGSAAVDVIEELSAPGSTVFRFDGTQFIYNWQTSKPWTGACRTLQVRLSDGTSHYAQFTFK